LGVRRHVASRAAGEVGGRGGEGGEELEGVERLGGDGVGGEAAEE
jgi:hypothetical protein